MSLAAYAYIIDMFSLRTYPPPPHISMFSRSPERKKIEQSQFLKLKSGYVNQTHTDDFTCTIVSISIVAWFTEAIE